MRLRIIFLQEFGKAFVPKKAIPNLRRYLMKAGINEVPYKFFGLLFYFSALITTVIFIMFIFPYLKNSFTYAFLEKLHPAKFTLIETFAYSFISWFVIQLFFSTLFILLIYFYLDIKIYQRTKKMEEQLPEFLQVLSSNLKAGMTFERALWAAIKPRFNILGGEMAIASKKVMTGYDVSKALEELADKYDSLMLRRTVDLMISEVESGGNVADLIDRLVDNLKETKALKDEMSAAGIAYIIFISVIVIFISPLIFALSFHLLKIILNFVGQLSSSTQRITTLPFLFARGRVNPNDYRTFSYMAIFVIALFSSLMVSIVEKGDMKGGIKYIPIFIFGSMAFYFIFLKMLGALFAGLL